MKLDKLPSDFAEEMNRAYQEDTGMVEMVFHWLVAMG